MYPPFRYFFYQNLTFLRWPKAGMVTCLVLMSTGWLWAQSPPVQGSLYLLTDPPNAQSKGLLMQAKYPDESLLVIDSTRASALLWHEEALFVAGGSSALGDTGVWRYTGDPLQRQAVLPQLPARLLAAGPGFLAVASSEPPYLRVFDDTPPYALQFELDTNQIAHIPTSLQVVPPTLAVLHGQSLSLINPASQQIDTTLAVPSVGFPSAAYPKYMSVLQDQLYLDLDYATGAIRSSLLRLDPLNPGFDSLYFGIGYASWMPPVAGGDKLYLYGYPSHYDLPGDSMLLVSSWDTVCIGYDPGSQAVLSYQGSTRAIFPLPFDSTLYQGLILPAFLKSALFVADTVGATGVVEEAELQAKRLVAAPNPIAGGMPLRLSATARFSRARLYDLQGRFITGMDFSQALQTQTWTLPRLPQGYYLLEVEHRATTRMRLPLLIR